MTDIQPPIMPSTEPEPLPSKSKSGRFWQVFWLTFLVASLGYAWYSFYAPSNRIAWADGEVMNAVNAAFIPVTIDVDNSNAAEILSRYGVGPTPTTIITDSKGSVLQRKQGRISKADFLELLGKLDPSAVEYL